MSTRSIFILIDALGWEKTCQTRFLPELSATRARLRAVLGYSGACQSSLFSGKTPAETGHWLMYHFTQQSHAFAVTRVARFLPGWVKNRGRLRHWLRAYVGRRIRGYFGLYHVPMDAFPHLDLSETESLYEPGGLAPCRSIFDDLEDTRTPARVWDWRVPEEESLESLLRDLGEGPRRFYLLYWTRLDALMHRHGTRAPEVDERIRWYEQAVRRVMDAASGGGETRVFVFSDHGMIDTRRTVDLMGAVDRLGFRMGEEYLSFYDSTLARFSFRTDRAREGILAALEAEGGGRWLDDDTLRSLGVFFPDRRYGEAVFLTDPGVLIAPSFMGPHAPRAMHGFHPDCPESDAHLVSNVKTDVPVESILDLYSVMKRELD